MATTWRDLILDQLDFYWNAHLWPRLDGLHDHEYLWEPAAGAWSLREGDDGVVRIESVSPEPPVAPITTIAWRMAHVGRDVFGKRARALFLHWDAPDEATMFDDVFWPEPLPLTAEGGLELLQQGYSLWRGALAEMNDEMILEELGPRGGPYEKDSIAALAMHLNREMMAHGAEICLLRDLYRAKFDHGDPMIRAAYAGWAPDLENQLRHRGTEQISRYYPSLLVEIAALHHWDAVQALIEAGFPVTGTVASGATALHYAAACGQLELVKDLLARGADPAATESTFGLTPLGWAEHFQQSEVATVLRAATQDA
ncbi:ankyrin repeat domain-containing protein [Tessaracoccus caeni]|uniref:ankyrin repeat domain-containing protein n=1 Tax=Tessaracoccus caeni TaxID=3031239 RepID=UPI0023DBF52C|nr:ankyrin repeat domain-containing protein [Tessaracoccus caeni]MDF1489696.1 ankyrin repeat domain-containing protein [Tessaracoccus caeni]